ncbi:hypothetical protein PHMEG_00016813 [Phytophthora megakarya]|uniref:Uncharacterized protein n=1 Tax=Phytophthora megakarya TaxID=4795 RepID=A0A225VZX4_9STRA|nr:hypothetical protein PHMEG_00016813 [Phytophthora megakarya]
MRPLPMNTSLPATESRAMKLVTDANEILDAQDMMTISRAQNGSDNSDGVETHHAQVDEDVGKIFIDWLRTRVSALLIFESAVLQTSSSAENQAQTKPSNASHNNGHFPPTGGSGAGTGATASAVKPRQATVATKPPTNNQPPTSSATRKCFKCDDLKHGVFQCSLANATKVKEFYDKKRKQLSPGYNTDEDLLTAKQYASKILILFLTQPYCSILVPKIILDVGTSQTVTFEHIGQDLKFVGEDADDAIAIKPEMDCNWLSTGAWKTSIILDVGTSQTVAFEHDLKFVGEDADYAIAIKPEMDCNVYNCANKAHQFRDDDSEFSFSMRLPYWHTIAFRKSESVSIPVIPWAFIDERWINPLRELKKALEFVYDWFNDSSVGGSAKRTRTHAQRYTDTVRAFYQLASEKADIEEDEHGATCANVPRSPTKQYQIHTSKMTQLQLQ